MCGIIGIRQKSDTPSIITSRCARGLLAGVANRGRESCGIALYTGDLCVVRKRPGTPEEAVPLSFVDGNPSTAAIGQTRYSTQGSGSTIAEIDGQTYAIDTDSSFSTRNAQPFYTDTAPEGRIVLVHNGNLTNTEELRVFLEKRRYRYTSETDSELIVLLIRYFLEHPTEAVSYTALAQHDLRIIINAIYATMSMLKGTFSCILMVHDNLFAFRDRHLNRPLKIAETDDHYIIASESAAWHKYQARYCIDIEGGEVVVVTKDALLHFSSPFQRIPQKCAFEKPYLMDPKSALTSEGNREGGFETVGSYRDRGGRLLYQMHGQHLGPGIIIPTMDSGEYYAQGVQFLHMQAHPGKSFYFNAYPKDASAGRTFILSNQLDRLTKLKIKFFNLTPALSDRIRFICQNDQFCWLILVDDSLVRSNTMQAYIERLRHNLQDNLPDLHEWVKIGVLLGTPPITSPCFYGIDTPTLDELAAAKWTHEEIRQRIGADYLGYLPLSSFKELQGQHCRDYCYACFGGEYVIPLNDQQRAALTQPLPA